MVGPDRLVKLDIWKVMPDLTAARRPFFFSSSFFVKDGGVSLCARDRRRKDTGDFILGIAWPSSAKKAPTGFIKLVHPHWNTLPRLVLLAGKLNGDTFIWRLLCPLTRNLTQVLYFDPDSQLFVSRPAFSRKLPPANVAYLARQFDLQLKLEEQQLKLRERFPDPKKMPADVRTLLERPLEIALKSAAARFLLATNGIKIDAQEDLDLIAMPKKGGRESRAYFRDKSGVVRMTPSAKRKLGIC